MKEPSSTVTDSTTAFSYVVVAFLTLVSFLMAQSIYELISANLEFLTLRHHATQVQLLLMIFAFQFIPALFLSTVWLIFKKLNSTLAKWFFNGVAFTLFLIFFLQVHNKLFSSHRLFAHSSVLALVPAVLLALLCASHPNAFRSFVLFLSPFVLIFPALFLFHTWQTVSAANQKEVPAVSSTSDNTGMERQRHPPVFMLILDELTRSTLLDNKGTIDGNRYPNFKNLAASSTFFRNATANADRTVRSLPVILTGNFPIGNDPSLSAYPDNLLSLLRPYYRIHVRELTTRFCREPDFDCPDGKYLSSSSELLKDTFLFYASGVVPTFLDSYKHWRWPLIVTGSTASYPLSHCILAIMISTSSTSGCPSLPICLTRREKFTRVARLRYSVIPTHEIPVLWPGSEAAISCRLALLISNWVPLLGN